MRSLTSLVLGVACLGAGCDQVFGLSVDEAQGATCAPLAYDQARYWSPDNRLWGLSWSGPNGAREACAQRAMDLAVLNASDSDELLNQAAGAPTPFWFGVSWVDDWTALDGCPPHLGWAPGEPSMSAVGQCVVMTSTGMATRSCAHVPMESGEHIQALCETPRPDARCRELEAGRRYALGSPAPVTHAAAVAACAGLGLRLVELNSSAELVSLREELGPIAATFWLGATYTGERWTSTTSCPQVFPWQVSEPDLGSGPTCAVVDPQGARTAPCADLAPAICEADR